MLKSSGSTSSYTKKGFSTKGLQALRLSLLISAISLVLKISGFAITHSTTALSDATESVVHLLAVIFVYAGYIISQKPADEKHPYGHERVEFFSVGIEGLVIVAAGITIIYQAINNALYGYSIAHIREGILFMGAAGLLNFGLGYYLLRIGRAEGNMILISNGKHTLTDVWTTGSVLVTLTIIEFTQWLWLDSVISIALAFYIGYEGYRLAHYSISGLMDSKDADKDRLIKKVLNEGLPENAISCHNLRHRTTGNTTWIEFHVLFNDGISLQEAHHEATILERKIMNALTGDVVVTIDLEPRESHEEDHELLKGINEKRSLEDFS